MAATTSGTVSLTSFPIRKIIDHAARRAKIRPEKLGGEDLNTALDLLFTITSEWANHGYPLWTKQFTLGGITAGSADVATPQGTVDVFHAYWRILQPYRGPDTLSNGAQDTLLFGGQANADVAITGPNPSVTVAFSGGATEIDTVGVLLGGSASNTAALQLQTSTDGSTFTTAQTLASTTFNPQGWAYFDLDPSISASYLRILNPQSGTWTLNQLQFALSQGQDIELGILNKDDYYNLPDKSLQGDRPNSVFIDRTFQFPVLRIWPNPNVAAFYNGTVSMLTRRYIQDPGTLNNILEIPQRGFEAMIWRLASVLIHEIAPEENASQQQSYFGVIARQQLLQLIEGKAAAAEKAMWAEERSRGPIRLAPDISGYTR
jgi:hypothetical protein